MTAARARRGHKTPRRRAFKWILVIYVAALVASNLVRWAAPTPEPPKDRSLTELSKVLADGTRLEQPQQVAWLHWRDGQVASPTTARSSQGSSAAPLILLHGSPGAASNFSVVAPALSVNRDVYAIDLPGFGWSTQRVPDYSVRAHAHTLLDWMHQRGIEQAHILGFSMGGGVALQLWDLEPARVSSLTLMASIGVQELELLGNYHLNHLLHGLQLVGFEGLRLLTPHFGVLDGFLDYSYLRNFFDTDQRPLREILERYDQPMLIVHGEQDPLVPKEAAIEHARIVPQSELVMRPDSHFFVFRQDSGAAQTIDTFLVNVDAGLAATRSNAEPNRITAAAVAFDLNSLPKWDGPALLVVLLLIALATLVSEDLTLIGTGLLVAQGRVDYLPAALAAFVGIVLGDMLLFWAGRAFGRRIVRRRPFSWWISPQAIRESSKWLRRRGAIVVLITRVLPGARLPTNVAAGLLRTSALRFLLYFLLAGVFWTFPVVWMTTRVGERILPQLGEWRWRLLAGLIVLGGIMWLVRKLIVPLATWRGRRRLLGAWRHRVRWEFWPSAMIYLPLIPYFLWLALRNRGLTVFTAANPGIPAGGFVGESKSHILGALPRDAVPGWILVPAESSEVSASDRLQQLQNFFGTTPEWPIVVKPDVGERGSGVLIARSWHEVELMLETEAKALIGQHFVAGREYSVFWMKRPSEPTGRVYSVTVKRRPVVIGDGRRSLFDLFLADDRAVALASTYLEEHPDAKERVPDAGEEVELSEVGAHSRGTIFEDGSHLITDELRNAVAAIAEQFVNPNADQRSSAGTPDTGFDFGRFDIITESDTTLQRGEGLNVLELNGVTSESTNIYDARYSVWHGLRVLADQWRNCYEIGAERRALGYRPTSLLGLVLDWRQARR